MLYEELKKLKANAKMTSRQIADASGVPESTVNRILSGETECPSFQNVTDIVKAMNGSLDELVGIPRTVASPMDDDYKKRLLSDLSIKDKWINVLFLILAFLLLLAFLCITLDFLVN